MGGTVEQWLKKEPKQKVDSALPPSRTRQWLDEQERAESDRLRTAASLSDPTKAEAAARILRLNEQTGIPISIIETDPDAIEKEWKKRIEPDSVRRTAPSTADWMAQHPDRVAAVGDDLPNLSQIERMVRALKSGARVGFAQSEQGMWGNYLREGGVLDSEQSLTVQELAAKIEAEEQTSPVSRTFLRVLYEGGKIYGQMADAIPRALTSGAAGASAGAAAGAVGGVLAAPLAAGGFLVGLTYGFTDYAFRVEGGQAYLELSRFRDAQGQPLSEDTKRNASLAVGAVNALLETTGAGFIVAPFRSAAKKLMRNAVEDALYRPTMAQALADFGKSYAMALVGETSTEVLQELTNVIAEELVVSADKLDTPEERESVITRLASIAEQTATGMLLVGLPGAITSGASTAVAARRSQRRENLFLQLGEQVANSEAFKRLPSSVQQIVEEATKDSPIEQVYIPIQIWDQYWQSKEQDPADIAERVTGSRDSWDEATRSGGDLIVPTARYATQIAPTEHNTFFANELRAGPMEMSAREAQEALDEQEKAAEEVDDEKSKQRQKSAEEVGEKVTEQLRTLGHDEATAKSYAELHARFFLRLGEQTGVDPAELFNRYGLIIRREAPDAEAQEKAQETVLDQNVLQRLIGAWKGIMDDPDLPQTVRDLADLRAMDIQAKVRNPPEEINPVNITTPSEAERLRIDREGVPGMTIQLEQNPRNPRVPPHIIEEMEQYMQRRKDALGSESATNLRQYREVKFLEHLINLAKYGAFDDINVFLATSSEALAPGMQQITFPVPYAFQTWYTDQLREPPNLRLVDDIAEMRDAVSETAEDWALRDDEPIPSEAVDELTAYAKFLKDNDSGAFTEYPDTEKKFKKWAAQLADRANRGATFGQIVRWMVKTDPNESFSPIVIGEAPTFSAWIADGEIELEQAAKDSTPKMLPGLRSRAEQLIEEKMPNKAHVKDVQNILKDVKKEEREWLELDAFLNSWPDYQPNGVITKQEMMEFLLANRLELKEVFEGTRTREGVSEEDVEETMRDYARSIVRHLTHNGWPAEADPNGVAQSEWDVTKITFEELQELEGVSGAMEEDVDDELWTYRMPLKPVLYQLAIQRGLDGDTYIRSMQYSTIDEDGTVFRPSYTYESAAAAERGLVGEIVEYFMQYDSFRDEVTEALQENEASTPTRRSQGRFEQYTLKGGSDYQIMLISHPTLPKGEKEILMYALDIGGRAHWSPGDHPVLVHVRAKARKNPAGQNVLFIEELQSDWHQQGRESGYREDFDLIRKRMSYKDEEGWWFKTSRQLHGPYESEEIMLARMNESEIGEFTHTAEAAVPDAPFRNTWHELAFKRILRKAVADGYDVIAWTTGEQQNDRYRLSQVADKIEVVELPEQFQSTTGKKDPAQRDVEFNAYNKEGETVYSETVKVTELANLIGKELAVRIMTQAVRPGRSEKEILEEIRYRADDVTANKIKHMASGHDHEEIQEAIAPRLLRLLQRSPDFNTRKIDELVEEYVNAVDNRNGAYVLEGENMEVGGHGMRAFYDHMLVKFADKFVKKYKTGVETGKVEVAGATNKLLQTGSVVVDDFDTPVTEEESRYGEISTRKMYAVVHTIPLTDELKRAALADEFHLFQKTEDRPRGRIRINRQTKQMNIDLLKNADLSTFIHESGHFFLEVLHDLKDSSPELRTDYDILRSWMGSPGDAPFTREQHEIFARGFERYLMEGRSPVPSLRKIFIRFKVWLLSVYRSAKELNVELSDEVRHVFDRMLASQQELAAVHGEEAMQPMFADEQSLPEEQRPSYMEAVDAANHAATEEMTATIMKDWRREQTAVFRSERKKVEKEVGELANEDKVLRARALLTRGVMPNGDALPSGTMPFKLSRDAILLEHGKEVLDALPKPIVWTAQEDNALHPDMASDLLGFDSGAALIQALLVSEEPKAWIQKKVNDIMRQKKYNMSPLKEGELPVEARKAVHNEKRAELLHRELQILAQQNPGAFRALARDVSGKPKPEEKKDSKVTKGKYKGQMRRIPTIETVRKEAEASIARKVVRFIKPATYLRAEQTAHKAAMEAFLAGDIGLAFQEKQKELINHELYRAATAAVEEADKIAQYANRFEENRVRERLGRAGGTYLQQIDGFLERFEFTRVPYKHLDQRQSLREFLTEHQELGFTPMVPEKLINEAFRENYRELTMEDLREVQSAMQQIEHLARTKNRLLASTRKRNYDAAKAEITDTIKKNHTLHSEPLDLAPDLKTRVMRGVKGFMAAHNKAEFIFEWLDGYKELGPVWTYFFKPFVDAENTENKFMKEAVLRTHKIFGKYSRAERSTWLWQKVNTPLGSLTKSNILSIALNWGNAYNRDALIKGYEKYGWTEDKVVAVLNGHLDQRDWDTVQAVWDWIDEYWPMAEALEKEVNGVAPGKVEALPVHTKFGTYRGGYYPIVFDRTLSWKQAVLDLKQKVGEMFGGQFAHAMTRHGHLEERKSTGGKALRLELSTLTDHVSNVIHDLTHRRAVIDVNRLIEDSEIRGTIEQAIGSDMVKQLRPWVLNIASPQFKDFTNPIEGIMSRARTGATVVNLGWKMTTSLVQFLGFTGSVNELGGTYAARGITQVFAHPEKFRQTWNFVTSRSEFMRHRIENYDRDVNDALKGLQVSGTAQGKFGAAMAPLSQPMRDSFFQLIGLMDMGVSLPTWMGAYAKAMEGKVKGVPEGKEEAAVDYADKVVRQTQGVGTAKDLATVQRGPETLKIFTMFYTYFAGLFNQFTKAGRKYKNDKKVGRLIATMALLWWVPAALGELLLGRAPSSDDDEAEWWKWLLSAELSYPFQSIVIVRDVVNGMRYHSYEPSAAFDMFAAMRDAGRAAAEQMGEAIGVSDDVEVSRYQVQQTVQAVGYVTQLPTRQIWLTAEYLYDWMTGEEEPANPAEGIFRTLVTGKPRE